LAKDIESEFQTVKVDFIEGSGGVFDITKNGILIFSKTRVGRFPNSDEIITKLKE
jgi:selT/selW/selH-like putative selenoprotein